MRAQTHRVPTLIATLLVVLAGATGAFATATSPGDGASAAGDAAVSDHTVTSADGTEIAITVFRPGGATAASPVPVVLHGHGWGGSRATAVGQSATVDALLDAGFGVVSVDARGHGESGGESRVMHKDYERHDYVAVLDFIHDDLDWVERESASGVAKDVVAGAVGGSYGGGYQLLTASHDGRLDALAPQMTWHDLGRSLAPNGVGKSLWVHLLYAAGKNSVNMHPSIDAWYEEIMATNTVPQAALDHFAGSNVVPADVEADVLLMQGVPDVLFNLNEALDSYHELEAAGAGDVRLFTYLGGHILRSDLVNDDLPPVGLQPIGVGAERVTSPCGDMVAMQVAWFDFTLRGGADPAIPEVSLALDQGGCVELDAMPAATRSVEVPAVVAPQGAGSVLIPLVDQASGEALVAGVPHVTAKATNVRESILEFSLVQVGGGVDVQDAAVGHSLEAHVVDDQSTPVRLAPADNVDLDLAGVATRLSEGDQLFLRVDGLNEWYATNSAREPGAVVLQDLVVTLPYDDAL